MCLYDLIIFSYMFFTYKRSTPVLYDFIKFGSSVLRIETWIGIIFQSQVDIKITEDQNKLQNPPF